MSGFPCDNCRQYVYSWEKHKCHPAWECCDPEYDETHWFKIHAIDEEDAAQRASAKLDQDDSRPTDHVILVRPYDSDSPVSRWDVSHELVVEYHAYESKERPAPPVKKECYDDDESEEEDLL